MLEYNMGLFGFGIFAGMIIALILMCIWGIFRKDDNNNNYKNIQKKNNQELKNEEIIEDLIMCDMLGIFR